MEAAMGEGEEKKGEQTEIKRDSERRMYLTWSKKEKHQRGFSNIHRIFHDTLLVGGNVPVDDEMPTVTS